MPLLLTILSPTKTFPSSRTLPGPRTTHDIPCQDLSHPSLLPRIPRCQVPPTTPSSSPTTTVSGRFPRGRSVAGDGGMALEEEEGGLRVPAWPPWSTWLTTPLLTTSLSHSRHFPSTLGSFSFFSLTSTLESFSFLYSHFPLRQGLSHILTLIWMSLSLSYIITFFYVSFFPFLLSSLFYAKIFFFFIFSISSMLGSFSLISSLSC